jgi:hypothetical protein
MASIREYLVNNLPTVVGRYDEEYDVSWALLSHIGNRFLPLCPGSWITRNFPKACIPISMDFPTDADEAAHAAILAAADAAAPSVIPEGVDRDRCTHLRWLRKTTTRVLCAVGTLRLHSPKSDSVKVYVCLPVREVPL